MGIRAQGIGGQKAASALSWRWRRAARNSCFGLAFLTLFALPVLVSGCVFGRSAAVPWYMARRDPTGLAPDSATTPDGVIQVYAARAVSWRGVFSVHTWIIVKPAGAARYSRYEVLGFGVANGAPSVRVDRTGPDNYWFGARPAVILDRSGPGLDPVIDEIRQAVAGYPCPHEYRAWPGPNSNIFTAYVARRVPELRLALPANAVGKDFLPGGAVCTSIRSSRRPAWRRSYRWGGSTFRARSRRNSTPGTTRSTSPAIWRCRAAWAHAAMSPSLRVMRSICRGCCVNCQIFWAAPQCRIAPSAQKTGDLRTSG